MNVTFVFYDMVVTTTVSAEKAADAVAEARDVLAQNGLDPDRAGEIQVDGLPFQG